MTIVHKAGNSYKNADGFGRWELPNTYENPASIPENEKTQSTIEGINITDVRTELFEEVRENHKQDENLHILTSLIYKYCKDKFLANSLDDIWRKSYDN
ncbi:hypothetical protein O181_005087 [Austropuccinia psidii MF-1]|uniref:Uncharacterized protein n=1 Tax=Austropuccinia psidii MF-1 TaxID=1389203 RepID=A0A9Q3GGD7_9BASI|nr:hypothetical protein [Austropuccinia psidii MF-1]